MDRSNTLHWMHVSDLHKGQDGTSHSWPLVRQQIVQDIVSQISRNGPLDLVIFSGDLAFKGSSTEFNEVKADLVKLWDTFAKLGSKPVLFAVPGNHDLVRPDENSVFLHVANDLRKNDGARRALLDKPNFVYRSEVKACFENYTSFMASLAETGIPTANVEAGLFPGDTSTILKVNGLNVGLIGLNSSWTHLSNNIPKSHLDIAIEQLSSVTGEDFPGWAMPNHINFLVTHHPDDWLSPDAREEFQSSVFVSEYFDAHFFGHMHDNLPSEQTIGAHKSRIFQAASLFGLEKIRGETDRRHGYTFAKLDVGNEVCEVWPRRIVQKVSRVWEVEADGRVLKGDQRSFTFHWPLRPLAPIKKHQPHA